jgi:hypothetical protein
MFLALKFFKLLADFDENLILTCAIENLSLPGQLYVF